MQHVAHRRSDEVHQLRAKIERMRAVLRMSRDQIDHNAYGRTFALREIDAALGADEQKARES